MKNSVISEQLDPESIQSRILYKQYEVKDKNQPYQRDTFKPFRNISIRSQLKSTAAFLGIKHGYGTDVQVITHCIDKTMNGQFSFSTMQNDEIILASGI